MNLAPKFILSVFSRIVRHESDQKQQTHKGKKKINSSKDLIQMPD